MSLNNVIVKTEFNGNILYMPAKMLRCENKQLGVLIHFLRWAENPQWCVVDEFDYEIDCINEIESILNRAAKGELVILTLQGV